MLLGVVKDGRKFRVKFSFAFSPHRKDDFLGAELYDAEIEAAVAYNEAASKQNVAQKKRKQKLVELNEGLPLTLEAYRRLDATQRRAFSQRLRAGSGSAAAENGSPSPSVHAAAADASTVSPNPSEGGGGEERAGGGDGASLCPEPTDSGNSPCADAPQHGARAAVGLPGDEQRQRTPSEPPRDGNPGASRGPDRAGVDGQGPGLRAEQADQAAGHDAAAGTKSRLVGLAFGADRAAAGDQDQDSFDDMEEGGQGHGHPAGTSGAGTKGRRTPASLVAAGALSALGDVKGGDNKALADARSSGAAVPGVETMGEDGDQGGAGGGSSRAVATLAALADAAMGSPGPDATPRAPSAGAEVSAGAAGALLLLGDGSASRRDHLGRPRDRGGQGGGGPGVMYGAAEGGPAAGEAGAGPSAPVAGPQGPGEVQNMVQGGLEGIQGPTGGPTPHHAAAGMQPEPGPGAAERAVARPPVVLPGGPASGAGTGQTAQGSGGGLGLREALELLFLSISSLPCLPTLARAFIDAGGSPALLLNTLRSLHGVELRQTEADLRDLAASLPPAPKRQRLERGSDEGAAAGPSVDYPDLLGPPGLPTSPPGSPSPSPAPLSREQYNALLSLHDSALFEGDELNFVVERAPAALVGLSKLVAAKAHGTPAGQGTGADKPTAVASTAAALGIRTPFLEWMMSCRSLHHDVLFAALRIDFDRVEAIKPLITVGGHGGRGLDGQASQAQGQQPMPSGVPISNLVMHLTPTCMGAHAFLQGPEPVAGNFPPGLMPGGILAGLRTWLRVAQSSGDTLELLRALLPSEWSGGGAGGGGGVLGDTDAALVLRIGVKLCGQAQL